MYVSNILRLTIIATWAILVIVNSLPSGDLTISIWATVMTCKTIPHFPIPEQSVAGLVILGMA